jgi:hypothetical protein
VCNHDHAAAVRDHDHRAVDRGRRLLDRPDAGGEVEIVAAHRRHRSHAVQSRRKQRLPVFVHVVAQTRNDQNRR